MDFGLEKPLTVYLLSLDCAPDFLGCQRHGLHSHPDRVLHRVAHRRRNGECELADGKLTRAELQDRLFLGAKPTTGGFAGRRTVPTVGTPIPFVTLPAVADTRFASEGYGTYRARLDGRSALPAA